MCFFSFILHLNSNQSNHFSFGSITQEKTNLTVEATLYTIRESLMADDVSEKSLVNSCIQEYEQDDKI